MSYDVYIGRDGDSLNHTSNLARLFYDFLPVEQEGERGGIWSLDGKTGAQAARMIADAWVHMDHAMNRAWIDGPAADGAFRAKYDPANGWGTTLSGVLFLARIQALCINNPREKVRVSG
jgi:hypothetical protein